ncbi:MAG: ABC transporter substrate binding protein [Porticoccaceae bacterium]|nr:hypothetical protein [Pseudomonadales bacterium]MCP5171974.1 hypothetical protein [Pseudomonadales bacterium]
MALVIYPQIREPFSKVFDDIVLGFDEQFNGTTRRLRVQKSDTPETIASGLQVHNPQVILALGNRSYDLYKSSNSAPPVLLGAVAETEEHITGVSMIPDAEVVLGQMLSFSPGVKKVYVIRQRGRLDPMLSVAKRYLEKRKIILEISECDDLQQGASAYRQVLDDAVEGDAIWVLPGSRLLDNAVLSLALNTAWQKNLVMFSSNPLHVKRGMLFAVYPDNRGMGASLGRLANETLSGEKLSGMMPLKDVLIAVNERTSRHLAIELTNEMKSNIDLLLPAR